MHEPSIQRVQRLLFLRQFPGFADAEVSELAVFAENAAERLYPAGAVIGGPDRPAAIHMVVDGRLEARGARRTWHPRQGLGALEAIAGHRALEPVLAAVPTRTLEVAADDFRELLADNFSVLTGARKLLAGRLLEAAPRDSCHGAMAPDPVAVPPAATPSSLDPLQRLQLLRRCLPFPGKFIQALAALARASNEERLDAGTALQLRGTRAETLSILVEGALRVTDPQRTSATATMPGQAFGRLETLAGGSYASTVIAETAARVLRVPAVAMTDVMEDHTDFALALMAQMASAVLELEGRRDAAN